MAAFAIPVLMYHRVAPDVDSPFCVRPDIFERQISALAAMYHTVTPSQAVEDFLAGKASGARSIILTFDDAYHDFYEYAFPVLQRYQATAALFLPTAHVGCDNLWNPKATYICRHMSWEDLRQVAGSGVEIGSHSATHHSLVKFDRQRALREICEPLEVLQTMLGVRPRAFAYPYGDFNGWVRDLVAEHYDLAFAVDRGSDDWGDDRFTLRRLYVGNDFDCRSIGGNLNRGATVWRL